MFALGSAGHRWLDRPTDFETGRVSAEWFLSEVTAKNQAARPAAERGERLPTLTVILRLAPSPLRRSVWHDMWFGVGPEAAWRLPPNPSIQVRGSLCHRGHLLEVPHFPILLKSIESANPRPKVVKYRDATLAMQDAATSALQGQVAPDAALSELQSKLESLTK